WFFNSFFFSSRRRHTRFSRDWSSDVCSSDLKLQGQEGVSNLVEAFLVAGSKSVVASLWNIDDASTSALMEDFYERLARGEPTSLALRNAKLNLLAKFGDQLSPYYWAAFICVGETLNPIPFRRPSV